MTPIDAFRSSLSAEAPPSGLGLALQALWWAGRGDWDRAHGCAQQQEGDPACDLVHAHLHRQEGDLGNARYWYRRAGSAMPEGGLEAEWGEILGRLLESGG
jgi:hypothetical protein